MPLPDFDPDSRESLAQALSTVTAEMQAGALALEPTEIEGEADDVVRLLVAMLDLGMTEAVAAHVEAVAGMLTEGHPGAWIGEEPVGGLAARALADSDVRYITLYAEFLNLVDIQRYTGAGAHVEALLDTYGLCPETMYLLIHWCAGVRAPDMTDVFARIANRHLVLEWLEETGQRRDFINIVAHDLADRDMDELPPGTPSGSLLQGDARGVHELRDFSDALCSDRDDIAELIWDVAFSAYCSAVEDAEDSDDPPG